MARAYTCAFLAAGLLAGCGSSTSSPYDLSAECFGGPTPGPGTTHCGGDGGLIDSGASVNPSLCGQSGDGDGGTPTYGVPMYGTTGDDDDCKYAIAYTVDPICESVGVTFTVTVSSAKDGSAVTGAATLLDVVSPEGVLAASVGTTTETVPGTYRITPVVFDASGQWTVRFHFFADCAAVDGSPRSDAAFYVTVP